MSNELLDKAKQLAGRPYPFKVYRDPESDMAIMYLAVNTDLDGCMAQGSSQKEAIKNLAEARLDYIAFLLERNLPVPEPSELIPSSSHVTSQHTFNIKASNEDEIQTIESDLLYEASLETLVTHPKTG
jgi:predicted RNase H-like HicB family nuclease